MRDLLGTRMDSAINEALLLQQAGLYVGKGAESSIMSRTIVPKHTLTPGSHTDWSLHTLTH